MYVLFYDLLLKQMYQSVISYIQKRAFILSVGHGEFSQSEHTWWIFSVLNTVSTQAALLGPPSYYVLTKGADSLTSNIIKHHKNYINGISV